MVAVYKKVASNREWGGFGYEEETGWKKCIYSLSELEPQLLTQVGKKKNDEGSGSLRKEERVYREDWISEDQGWAQSH